MYYLWYQLGPILDKRRIWSRNFRAMYHIGASTFKEKAQEGEDIVNEEGYEKRESDNEDDDLPTHDEKSNSQS